MPSPQRAEGLSSPSMSARPRFQSAMAGSAQGVAEAELIEAVRPIELVSGVRLRKSKLLRFLPAALNDWIILALLMLASAHCITSLLYVNVTAFSLTDYEQGKAVLPFQGRVLMVPAMRWANSSPPLQHIADKLNVYRRSGELYTPEKVVCVFIGIFCLTGMGLAATFCHTRASYLYWWLPWVLVLSILYTSYAARTSQPFWYPYDFPAFFFFGLGTVFILRGWFWPLAVLMPVAAANRETAILMAFLWLVYRLPISRQPVSRHKIRVLSQTGLMVLLWAVVRVVIYHAYAHNPAIQGFPLDDNERALLSPDHWPQLFSALGFIAPVLWLNRRWLSEDSRRLLFAILPCLAFILYFGVWLESRVLNEFTVAFALLAAEEWERSSRLRIEVPTTAGEMPA